MLSSRSCARLARLARLAQLAFAGSLLVAMFTETAAAQVIRGVVRSGNSLMPIDLATVTARDTNGTVLATGRTNALGEYQFNIRRAATPFQIQVRRLGYAVSTARVRALEPSDTVDFEFLVNEVAAVGDAVVVTADASLNERRLNEATRRGWKVYDPELIARHRDQASDFHQLLRALGIPGLIMPRRINDCIRATRNNQCLTFVIDNQVMGFTAIILPSDIYFLAILGASDARIQFGDRAPYGAIAIYTRSRLDRPRRRPDDLN